MNREITLRVILDIILLVSLVSGFWYVAIPVGIFSLWIFPAYAELIIFAFIHDALFGMNGVGGIYGYLYLINAVILTLVSYMLKGVIKR